MGKSLIRNCSVAVASALVVAGHAVMVPSPVSAAPHEVSGEEVLGFDGLMAKAEEQRGAGEHAAAARSYAAAHRALADEDDRAGPMGELVIDNALADYALAREQAPEDQALVEEPVALLEEFIEMRDRAHAAGRAEAVPPRLLQELERLKALVEEARTPVESSGASSMVRTQPSKPMNRPESSKLSEPLESSKSPALSAFEEPSDPADSEIDVTLLVGGVVSTVGGVALIGGGAWNFEKINRQAQARSTALEEGEYTDEAREAYQTELDAWTDRWRGASTGLVVAGSVLAATGIGLTTWGAIRMRRSGRGLRGRASLGVPIVSRDRISVGAKMRF
ncbi:MAG: hypothetical protein KDK70_32560 [Myxococcales bacterium]|nr:hypothetical protein [Myxococcales bacterium]